MNSVKITEHVMDQVTHHLFDNWGEHFAFLLAESVNNENGDTTMLVTDVLLIDDKDIDYEDFSAKLRVPALLNVINTANRLKVSLIEVHNHGGGWEAGFSKTDLNGFKEFVPYVLESLPNRPYAALVLTPDGSVDGLVFTPEGKSDGRTRFKSKSIDHVYTVGERINKITTTSGKRGVKHEQDRQNAASSIIHSRQELAIGREGQDKLASTTVAIVGVGGLGSHVVQQLAYLGVRNFIIIDHDIVEPTNLNRLIGATPGDVGKPKVDVAERNIKAITGSKAVIRKVSNDLRSKEAFDTIKHADVIFGCVDTSGARLILNEIATAYLIHYIDCATGINLDRNGKVDQAGGHVMVVKPSAGPCLLCANIIDLEEAANDLMPPEERERKRRQGYIHGANVPDPSVVSLNGVVASLAVVEFQMLVTGLRPARTCTLYDMMEVKGPSTVTYAVKTNPECLHHSYAGIGDRIKLERYLPPNVVSTDKIGDRAG